VTAAPELTCEGGFRDLPESFFDDLGLWQPRYSRDSLKLSRDFLYSIFEPHILPHLEEALQRCPAAVLEIMMNSVLAVDMDRSPEEAEELYDRAMLAAHVARSVPAVGKLLSAWVDDTVHVYPFLFGSRSRHCYNSSLKVFVYDVPENLTRPLVHCAQGQWGTEVLFHRFLLSASCRTTDPEEADFFYVPIYGTCLFVKHGIEHDADASDLLWHPLVDFLATQTSFSHRGQLDHIFLFADGQSARIWDSYDLVRSSAIFMMVESKCPTWDEPVRDYTDVKSCSSAWKDIIIPGYTDHARARYMQAHNLPVEERDILVTFHGRHPGGHDSYAGCAVRGMLMDLAGRDGVDVGGFVPDYLERKGRSRFCLVPGGTSPWTNHLYESFFSGCVPVIISDEYEVAFQHQVEWPLLSIKWPEALVNGRLYDFLRTFPPAALHAMKAEVDRHACWFDYFSEDPMCSPYLAVLRALAERKHHFPPSPGRFWNAEAALREVGRSQGLVPRRVTRFHVMANESFRL